MSCLRIINSWPIRIKLLVLIVVVFLPGAGIIIVNGLRESEEHLEKATSDAFLLVESLSAQQEQVAAGTKQMLSTLAQLPEVQNLDTKACDDLFRKITARQTYYSNMSLNTPDGNMVAGSNPFEPGSINLSDRKQVEETIRDLDFSAGEYVVGKTSNLPSIHYAYPVLGANNRLLAILNAGFKLDEYAGFIQNAGLPEGSAVVITDHKGRRLYRLPENDTIALGKPVPSTSLARLLGGVDHGTYEINAEDGVNRIYAFKQLRLRENLPPYLCILVGIPKDAVLHRANLVIFNSLLILGLAAAVSLSLAWFFGSFVFLSPINRLVATSQRFGTGEMGARTCLPHTSDELGKLARTFDDMASQIEVRDIARRRAEYALRDSEAQLRQIIDLVPHMIFVKDWNGKYILVNQAVAESYNTSVSALTGKAHADFHLDERELQRLLKDDREVTTAEARKFIPEEPFTDAQGDMRFLQTTKVAFHTIGDYAPAVLGVAVDITERKRAEEALCRSNARISHLNDVLRAIRDVSSVLKSAKEPSKLLTAVCNSLVQTRGYVFVWIGQREAGSKLVLPVAHSGANSDFLQHTTITWDDSPNGRGPAGTAMRERRSVVFDDLASDPHFALWKDPVTAYGAASIASVPLLHQELLFGVLTVKADHPQAFDAEEVALLRALAADVARALQSLEDERAREQAEQAVRSLEEQLQRAEKMEALGTMAGGVAHDLNNVLGVVIGYSELLLNVEDSRSAKSHVMEILKAGQRAATIVQDLLTLTRRGVQNKKVLNLNNIVIECQELPEFTKLVSYHPKVQIRTDLEADLLNISGSTVHLGKTFINLISNAAEAMPNGGVITVKTENQYLDKPVSGYDEVKDGDYIVLSVSDEGEGIPAADLRRIFEPFYTKKVMGRSGTGLGLTVVWGTVKDHQGYIDVESQEGKGTIFTLYFPVTREELSPEEVAVAASEYMGNGETILVVDDVKEQRDLASIILKKLNYNVASVSSGEEAVEYMKLRKVDLVVLDMIMDPGIDGLDTYAKILVLHPRQKAIIVSGFAETERVAQAQSLGACEYVKKPYALEKLGLAVRKELDRPA